VGRVVDTFDGITETMHYDEAADTFTIARTADVQAVADDVAAKHSQTLGKCEMGWHVGSIPMVTLFEYARQRGIANPWDLMKPEYAGELMRLCTDSDYRKFSPTGGKA
jgi:hypothetical protein